MRRSGIGLALVCALTLAACGGSGSGSTKSSTTTSSSTSAAAATSSTAAAGPQMGYEGVPLEQGPTLAPASSTGTAPAGGTKCASVEQLAYHIHAHLAVFDGGTLYQLPAGIGIPDPQTQQTQYGPVVGSGKCFYWLHTHTSDGIIHIESPTKRIYTLGDFFAVWRQPLGPDRIARLHGRVTAFVNGKPWTKDPRDIPLVAHADIQLEIGQPAPPIMTVDWSKTQL